MFNSQVFMDKAVEMMRNSNMNISEISEILGFKNPFYFSRVFRGYAIALGLHEQNL